MRAVNDNKGKESKKRKLITVQLRNKDLMAAKKLYKQAKGPAGHKRSATLRALVRLGLWTASLGKDGVAAPSLSELSVF
jgi:hypothetical protein